MHFPLNQKARLAAGLRCAPLIRPSGEIAIKLPVPAQYPGQNQAHRVRWLQWSDRRVRTEIKRECAQAADYEEPGAHELGQPFAPVQRLMHLRAAG